MLEKIFKLSANKTDAKTEVLAGITTFMTMAYILAVNPNILSATGMDSGAVFTATALAAFLGTLLMAIFANYPFALAPGMGLNAYFAYTVVIGMGYSWEYALTAVFAEGIVFIVLSLTNVREAIFNAIPLNLKSAVSVGIGLFIAFIGLQNSGLCVDSATLVGIISFPENFHTAGICALLTLIGLFFTAVFYTRKMKGAILYGILLTWILGMLCQVTGLYVPTPDAGFYSLFPSWGMTDFSKLGLTFGQCFNVDFSAVGIVNFIVVIFSFLFVDIFDTLGTLIGVATKAKMLDKDGKMPKMKEALLADAVGTVAGACTGTSTVTTFIESGSGVEAGGRTGLTALTTAVMFLLCMFIAPIAALIPAPATSAALIYVGILMLSGLKNVDWDDILQVIPVALMLIFMPITGSIGHGIGMALISYSVVAARQRRSRS